MILFLQRTISWSKHLIAYMIVSLLLLASCSNDNSESSAKKDPDAPQPHIKTFVKDLLKLDDGKPNIVVTPVDNIATTKTIESPNKLNEDIRILLAEPADLLSKQLPDFSAYQPVAKKKQAFFDYLRPLATMVNEEVEQLRQELLAMDPNALTQTQKNRLVKLARTYKVNDNTDVARLTTLLKKIYPIPTALTLAQAANESGWGSSRFAVQGNNLFGQWCFQKGCGLVPAQRDSNSRHEVKIFSTPKDSVAAYVRNLNSHSGYVSLRNLRRCLMEQGQTVTGRDLAYGLINYSSRGIDYVNEITQLIRQNKLEPWASTWWGQDQNHPCAQWLAIAEPVMD